MQVHDINNNFIKANVLDGVKPKRGSSIYQPSDFWEGGDSLFSDGMLYIETIIKNPNGEEYGWEDPNVFYGYQASYLLLWSIIERYASLRYYLKSKDTMNKIKKFAEEKIFSDAISKINEEFKEVYNSSQPKKKCVFDPSNPIKTINYFYQIRSNITHRGKECRKMISFLVKNALVHLHSIFAKILDANRLRS